MVRSKIGGDRFDPFGMASSECHIMSGWWLASYLALWLVVILLVALVIALARQVGTLHLRLGPRGALEIDDEGPPLGEAPELEEHVDDGGRLVRVGGPGGQLVLFVSPGCQVCRAVLPGVPAVARAGGLTPVVVFDGDDGSPRMGDQPALVRPELAERWAVPGTPYLVVLDVMGVVRAKGTVNNLEQMEGLVDTANRRLEADLRGEDHG
jgi:methylamine dehydrogenase accessory protein MauD